MSDRPTRETVAGRAYLDLRKLAQEQGRPTAELIQLYALEGFLRRLSGSPLAEHLVLKGGVLLAAHSARRTTRDIDVAAHDLDNSLEAIEQAVVGILRIPIEDGLSFSVEDSTCETIREGAPYAGVRVIIPCRLATARARCQVDLNVGDPILPPPERVQLPRLLGGTPIPVNAYPLSMVLAEKLVTAVQRGSSNTRWRDFADIYVLARRDRFDQKLLYASIDTVARHRNVEIEPLEPLLRELVEDGQAAWTAWLRTNQTETPLPTDVRALVEGVCAFSDPVLERGVHGSSWDPVKSRWM